jgi:hypothetical protein
MKDENNSDRIEGLVEAFLSWTLQCCDADNAIKYNNYKSYKYCRKIASVLLFGNPDSLDDNVYKIERAETWKQWDKIDLRAEFEITNIKTQEKKKYALLIEVKGYSSTHSDQLARYKTIFKDHYNDKGFESEFIYFSCKDNLNDTEKKDCLDADYRAYTMKEVFDLVYPNDDWDYTGNALFDEFWFTTW